MIELHLHLDGSLRVETALDLAREQKIVLPTEDKLSPVTSAMSKSTVGPMGSITMDVSFSPMLAKFNFMLSALSAWI